MQRLSFMYQETEGGADIAAFATLTLWLCAVESFCPPLIPESTNRLERTQSHGYGMTALSSLTRVKQMSTLQLDNLEQRGKSVPCKLSEWGDTHRRMDQRNVLLESWNMSAAGQ
jgi:hypothetical protein